MVQEAWRWDVTQPQSRTVLSVQKIAGLGVEVTELQRQRSRIRTLIGEENDIRARQLLYGDLHAVGLRLAPLERELLAAPPGN